MTATPENAALESTGRPSSFSYEELIDSYVEKGGVEYLVDSRFLITFDLGGLFKIGTKTSLTTYETIISPSQ